MWKWIKQRLVAGVSFVSGFLAERILEQLGLSLLASVGIGAAAIVTGAVWAYVESNLAILLVWISSSVVSVTSTIAILVSKAQYRAKLQADRNAERAASRRFHDCLGQILECHRLVDEWLTYSRSLYGRYRGSDENLVMFAELRTLKDKLDSLGIWTPPLELVKSEPDVWSDRLKQLDIWVRRYDLQNARKPRDELDLDYSQ